MAEARRPDSSYAAYVSTNATTWRELPGLPIGRVSYAGGLFFVSGDYRVVAASPDGFAWSTHDLQPYSIVPPIRARGLFLSRGRQYPGDVYQMLFWQSVDGLQWQVSPLPYTNYSNLELQTFGNGTLLGQAPHPAAGEDLYLSEDLTNWTVQANTALGAGSFTFAHGVFIAVRPLYTGTEWYSVVNVSRDGLAWSEQSRFTFSGTSAIFYRVAYANGTYLASGDSRYVAGSRDLVHWTSHDTGITNHLPAGLPAALFWHGRFVLAPVAVGDAGDQLFLTSGAMAPTVARVRFLSDFCRRLPDGSMLLTVEAPYGVAVTVEASENLAAWTRVATDSCDLGEFEVYDEEAKALGHRFYRAYQTTNAPPLPVDPLSQWTQSPTTLTPSSGSTASWRVAYGNANFVAVADYRAYRSPDGLKWARTSTNSHRDVAFGDGRFVTIAEIPYTSPDGLIWTQQAARLGSAQAVTYGRRQFMTQGPSSGGTATWQTYCSPDGVKWETNSTDGLTLLGAAFGAMTFGLGRQVGTALQSMGGPPPYGIWSSADSASWRLDYTAPSWDTSHRVDVTSLAYGHGHFVAAGHNTWATNFALLVTSDDGVHWNQQTGGALPATALTYANGIFLGLGYAQGLTVVLSSADGRTWVRHTDKAPVQANWTASSTFGGGRFIIASDFGSVYRSGVVPPHVSRPGFWARGCVRLPDGAMLLTVEAPYGRPVTVEASEDLRTWTPLATDPCDRGEFEVYDEAAKTGKHRFYRAWQAAP